MMDSKEPGGHIGLFSLSIRIYLVHSAYPSISFTILSPPEVSRHISTSLPAGTGLAQVICGLLKNLVVENLQLTMQDASLFNEFVIMTLATSAPGKMTQLNGTGSADAGADSKPVASKSWGMADRDLIRLARAISLPPFSMRR
jgi:hypothetical protein